MTSNKRSLRALVGITVALTLATPASGIITFRQLSPNTFTVSHRVKGIGSRAKATALVTTKAASLCIAAGFRHLEILDQESEATQEHEAANATMRVRFQHAESPQTLPCEANADPEYIAEARNQLARRGYQWPDPPEAMASDTGESTASCASTCSIEQIAAMARTGLSDDQIRAACSED